MTEHEQRVAIAEACGWELLEDKDSGWWTGRKEPEGNVFGWNKGMSYEHAQKVCYPDYFHDPDAMYEAERVLGLEQRFVWQTHMRSILGLDGGGVGLNNWEFAHATAAQRAEAFLKTIGKWKE